MLTFDNAGGNKKAPNLDSRIQLLHLSAAQLTDILAFLDALNSDVSIFTPERKDIQEK